MSVPDPHLIDRALDVLKAEKEAMGSDAERLLVILGSNRQVQAMVQQYASQLRISDAIVSAAVMGYFLRDKVQLLEMKRAVERVGPLGSA